MIEVSVESVALDKTSRLPVVILRDPLGDRVLPIWIGPGEANAIAMHLGGIDSPRPLTHDLMVAVLGALGGRLDRVVITRVEDSTYYAQMIIDRDGDVISVDARPSDCIALALRAKARIFAEGSLLESVIVQEQSEDDEDDGDDGEDAVRGEDLEERLRRMRPEDLGRFEP